MMKLISDKEFGVIVETLGKAVAAIPAKDLINNFGSHFNRRKLGEYIVDRLKVDTGIHFIYLTTDDYSSDSPDNSSGTFFFGVGVSGYTGDDDITTTFDVSIVD